MAITKPKPRAAAIDTYAGNQFSWQRYARGRYREFRVSETLLGLGYWVYRSQKSLSPADLLVRKPEGTGFMTYDVQVKLRKQPNRAEPKDYDLKSLIDMANACGETAVFVGNDEHGGLLWWQYLGGVGWKEWSP